jgi:hypothetical protein
MFVARHAGWPLVGSLGILLGACGPDTTPDAFTFTDRNEVEFSTIVESDEVIVTGIEEPVPIDILAGEYSIDGQPYTAGEGTVEDGQAVRVRLTSADDYGVTRSATLTIGGVSDSFDVTTERDVEPPAASIAFPHLDETWVKGSEVVVRGVASDNAGIASVTVRGVEATSSDGFATWQARLQLDLGQGNDIDVEVTDVHGNVADPADSITVNTHANPFGSGGRGCGTFSYDLANNRMFTRIPLEETSLADGTVTPVTSVGNFDYWDAIPLYDDEEERLYIVNDGVLAEVDLTDYDTVTTISPEGRNGISLGWVPSAVLDQTNGIVYAYSETLAAVVSIEVAGGTRSIVTGNTAGAGPELGPRTFLAFGGSRLFAATGDFEAVVLEVDLENGNRTVVSGNGAGSGSAFLNIQGLAAGGASSTIYAADLSGDLFAVDPSSGARSIVSPATEGLRNGAIFEQDLGIQFIEGNGMVLISDCQHRQLFSIDPGNGVRSILTPPFRGDGPPLLGAVAIAIDQAGDTLMTLNRKGATQESTGSVNNLISVDASTGDRAIVSNAAVGSGDSLSDAFDLVEDSAHGRYLVTDRQARAIVAIDADTGDRAVLSDNVSHGAGVQFSSPAGIAIEPGRNRAVVVDSGLRALLGVDLETGDRTVITQVGGAGSGDDFVGAVDVALDLANDRAFVTDQPLNAVFRVDLSSGARAIVSGNTAGSGDPLQDPTRIAFDSRNDRIVVTNLSLAGPQNLLAYIDPDTGAREWRTITGGGYQPEAMVFDPESGLLYYTEALVFAYDYESSTAVVVSQ